MRKYSLLFLVALLVFCFASACFANEELEMSEQAQAWFNGNEVIVKWFIPQAETTMEWMFDIYPENVIKIKGETVTPKEV